MGMFVVAIQAMTEMANTESTTNVIPLPQTILAKDGCQSQKCLSTLLMLPMQFKITRCMCLEVTRSLHVATVQQFRFLIQETGIGLQIQRMIHPNKLALMAVLLLLET